MLECFETRGGRDGGKRQPDRLVRRDDIAGAQDVLGRVRRLGSELPRFFPVYVRRAGDHRRARSHRPQATHIASATLVASAIGGWIAGILADRYGRVRVLQVTILWFAVFGLLSAFTQEYWQLMTCRVLMGLGLGGEWAVGAILIGEVIRAKDRGKAVGAMQSGWAVGWGIVALVAIFVMLKARPDISWRVLLCLGFFPHFSFSLSGGTSRSRRFISRRKKIARQEKPRNGFPENFLARHAENDRNDDPARRGRAWRLLHDRVAPRLSGQQSPHHRNG